MSAPADDDAQREISRLRRRLERERRARERVEQLDDGSDPHSAEFHVHAD